MYQPKNPLPCGAVVWIEVTPDTLVIPQLLKAIEESALSPKERSHNQ